MATIKSQAILRPSGPFFLDMLVVGVLLHLLLILKNGNLRNLTVSTNSRQTGEIHLYSEFHLVIKYPKYFTSTSILVVLFVIKCLHIIYHVTMLLFV